MNKILQPAIFIMNRLHYSMKILFLFGIVSLIFCQLSYKITNSNLKKIQMLETKAKCLDYANEYKRLLELVDKHRGSSRWIANHPTDVIMQAQIKSLENEADKIFTKIQNLNLRIEADSKLNDSSTLFQEQWNALIHNKNNLSIQEVYDQNIGLSDDLLDIIETFIINSQYISEEDILTFHLIQTAYILGPQFMENMLRMRSIGVEVLNSKMLTKENEVSLKNSVKHFIAAHMGFLKIINNIKQQSIETYNVIASNYLSLNNQIWQFDAILNDQILSNNFQTNGEDFFKLINSIAQEGKNLFALVENKLAQNVNNKLIILQSQNNVQVASIIITVAIFLYFFLGLIVSFRTNLHAIKEGLHAFADNNFTIPIAIHSRDELYYLAHEFNTMTLTLKQLIHKVRTLLNEHMELSQKYNKDAIGLDGSSNEQMKATELIARAIVEMSASINAISQDASHVTRLAQGTQLTSVDAKRIAETVVVSIQELSNIVNNTTSNIDALKNSSSDINVIANSINEIAEQTNLLALNAAIEAARAGEQGRGFAVVADEVRNLAKRTSDATIEIKNMIEGIQKETNKVVGAMQYGSTEVAEGVKRINEIIQPLAQLNEAASNVLANTNNLSDNIRHQRVVADEISTRVEFVAYMSKVNYRVATHMAQNSQSILKNTQSLKELTEDFKV